MGIRYQKRIRLTKGLGLNVSNRGVSSSYRNKHGTIGSRGFSIRTGIPGLSFRSSWGKSKEGLAFLLILGTVYLAVIVLYNIALLLIYLIKLGYATVNPHAGKNL